MSIICFREAKLVVLSTGGRRLKDMTDMIKFSHPGLFMIACSGLASGTIIHPTSPPSIPQTRPYKCLENALDCDACRHGGWSTLVKRRRGCVEARLLLFSANEHRATARHAPHRHSLIYATLFPAPRAAIFGGGRLQGTGVSLGKARESHIDHVGGERFDTSFENATRLLP